MRFLLRVLITAVAVGAATWIVDGISVDAETAAQRTLTVVAVGAILGVVNAFVRPLVRLLSIPLYILTLGLITFVINAFMLLLAEWVAGWFDLQFNVDGFWSALWGALIISVVSIVLSWVLPDRED